MSSLSFHEDTYTVLPFDFNGRDASATSNFEWVAMQTKVPYTKLRGQGYVGYYRNVPHVSLIVKEPIYLSVYGNKSWLKS